MSKELLEELIGQERIQIIPSEVWGEYTRMALEKFDANFDLDFEGKVKVDLLFPKVGSFIVSIAPSNPWSSVLFVKTKENLEENVAICGYNDCIQIKFKTLNYQVKYLY